MPLDTHTTLTPDDIDAVRAEVRAVMQAENLPATRIAEIVGVKYGTFSSWMGGTYAGRNDRVAEDTRKGLEAYRASKHTRSLAPRAPGFVLTPTSEAITGRLSHAQHMGAFAVATGGPGVGKTTTLRAYKAQNPNVFIMTAEPVHATPRALLDDLAETLGISLSGLSSQRLSRAITNKLKQVASPLLIIDEGQHLPSQALDQLRSIHDLTGAGVCLVGNETIFARLEGGTRSAHYAQLFSRVGLRFSRPKPVAGDIDGLLDAWGVTERAERKLLHAIARKPGALRSMTQVLRIAHMLAGAEGAERVTERHLLMGWEQHSGSTDVEPERAGKAA